MFLLFYRFMFNSPDKGFHEALHLCNPHRRMHAYTVRMWLRCWLPGLFGWRSLRNSACRLVFYLSWGAFWRPQPKPNQLNKSVTGWSEQYRQRAQPKTQKCSTDNQCFWLGSPKHYPGMVSLCFNDTRSSTKFSLRFLDIAFTCDQTRHGTRHHLNLTHNVWLRGAYQNSYST